MVDLARANLREGSRQQSSADTRTVTTVTATAIPANTATPAPATDSAATAAAAPSATPSYDLIVVGAGGAGLAAACAAAQRGARVLIVEKLPALLGTTAYSVGSFAAAATRIQSAAGITDWPADFAQDMALAYPQTPDTAILRDLLARESGPTLDWLEELGVVFVGPYPEPPNRVPRMHNAVPAGYVYLQVLAAHARRLGVEFRLATAVTDLLMTQDRVTGVRLRRSAPHQSASFAAAAPQGKAPDDDTSAVVLARAVVLAAGDYSASQSWRAAHLSKSAASAIPINPNSLGDGHRLALQAGAALKRMDGVFGPQLRFAAPTGRTWLAELPNWRWLRQVGALLLTKAPPRVLGWLAKPLLVAHMSPADHLFHAGAVLVDQAGVRVEAADGLAVGLALRCAATGYVVGDAALARRFAKFPDFISTAPGIAFAYFQDYARGRPDLVHWAANAETLASKLDMDAQALREATTHLAPPLFALGPCNAMLTVTEGGAAIDAHCRVLNPDGAVIGGLYAAGGNGQSGLMLKGHGLHLAWAMTSGRVAGCSAAALSRTG